MSSRVLKGEFLGGVSYVRCLGGVLMLLSSTVAAGESQAEARDQAAERAGETVAQRRWNGLAGVGSHGEGRLPGDPEW